MKSVCDFCITNKLFVNDSVTGKESYFSSDKTNTLLSTSNLQFSHDIAINYLFPIFIWFATKIIFTIYSLRK